MRPSVFYIITAALLLIPGVLFAIPACWVLGVLFAVTGIIFEVSVTDLETPVHTDGGE